MNSVTIKKVAEETGVSLATVSRVFNDSANVSEDVARRVREVASRLGYARGPRTSKKSCYRTGNIALVYAGWSIAQLDDWGFMDSLESVITQHGLRLVLLRLPQTGELPRVLTERGCDGVLVVGELTGATEEQIRALAAFPCIGMIRRDKRLLVCDEICCDDYSVAGLAMETLKQAGATRYAFYNARPDHSGCHERRVLFDFHLAQNGFKAQHFEAEMDGFLNEPAHVVAGNLVRKIAAARQRPDGLFVPMDSQLPELYTALRAHGIEPGKDIKLVSCDNNESYLVKVDPRPTSIDLHCSGIGSYAARQLIWRIEHPGADAVRIFVKPQVVPGVTPSRS